MYYLHKDIEVTICSHKSGRMMEPDRVQCCPCCDVQTFGVWVFVAPEHLKQQGKVSHYLAGFHGIREYNPQRDAVGTHREHPQLRPWATASPRGPGAALPGVPAGCGVQRTPLWAAAAPGAREELGPRPAVPRATIPGHGAVRAGRLRVTGDASRWARNVPRGGHATPSPGSPSSALPPSMRGSSPSC